MLLETLGEVKWEREKVSEAAVDDLLQRGFAFKRYQFIQKEWNRNDGLSSRIGQVEFEFALSGERVQRDNHGPRFQKTVISDEELG
jgi:hypothetical protein